MLFVAGYHASGKSVLARHLEDNFGLLHIETSSIVKDFKSLDDPRASMKEWAQKKEAIHGMNCFDELIVATIKDVYRDRLEMGAVPNDLIITGNRSLAGIQYIAERLAGINDKSATILAVKATDEDLYDRYRERDRTDGDRQMTFDEFQRLTADERDTGIEEIFQYADYTLFNHGTEREFINSVEEFCIRDLGMRDYRLERDIWHEGDRMPGAK